MERNWESHERFHILSVTWVLLVYSWNRLNNLCVKILPIFTNKTFLLDNKSDLLAINQKRDFFFRVYQAYLKIRFISASLQNISKLKTDFDIFIALLQCLKYWINNTSVTSVLLDFCLFILEIGSTISVWKSSRFLLKRHSFWTTNQTYLP